MVSFRLRLTALEVIRLQAQPLWYRLFVKWDVVI